MILMLVSTCCRYSGATLGLFLFGRYCNPLQNISMTFVLGPRVEMMTCGWPSVGSILRVTGNDIESCTTPVQ